MIATLVGTGRALTVLTIVVAAATMATFRRRALRAYSTFLTVGQADPL